MIPDHGEFLAVVFPATWAAEAKAAATASGQRPGKWLADIARDFAGDTDQPEDVAAAAKCRAQKGTGPRPDPGDRLLVIVPTEWWAALRPLALGEQLGGYVARRIAEEMNAEQ